MFLEFHPKLPDSILLDGVKLIKKNIDNWSKPFFMDVYNYADLAKFKEVCEPFIKSGKLEHLIILGTGGSIQTMLALEGLLNIKLHAIVSTRPREIKKVLVECSPEKSIVIPISRGGKTLDVNSTLDLFKDYPMIALSSQGPMYDYLVKRGMPILSVPDVSGRFAASICSVALVPSLLGGIDIDSFLQSLAENYTKCKNLEDLKNNSAVKFAIYLYILYNNGYRNIFNMPYSSFLEGFTGLFVQEISESSGKEGNGLLGTSQPAPLCQHSVLELLLGGSKGHTAPVLWTTIQEPQKININAPEFGLDEIKAIDIINHQADATFQALLQQGIPTAKITIDNIDLNNYATLISFIQSSVYYFCMLLDVNWESNPLVNTSKKICNNSIENNLTNEERQESRVSVADQYLKNIKF